MTARWRNDIVVGHFVRSDTGHVLQAFDVTRHSRITQQLVPCTTVLSFVCCSQFACKKLLLMTFGTTLVLFIALGTQSIVLILGYLICIGWFLIYLTVLFEFDSVMKQHYE